MANPAAVSDLEDLWRPLTPDEQGVAQAWLDAAWAVVEARYPTIDQRMDDGEVSEALVRVVVTSMVLRVLRNPEGKRQETIDDYSWTRDNAVSSGLLYLSGDELGLLAGAGPTGAFTIRPYGEPGVAWNLPSVEFL